MTKLRSLGALAALLMTTSMAHAAFNADDVAAQLASDGYTRIEIKIGQNIAKVEAIKGATKLEVTYDIASGNVIKTETEAVESDDDTRPGVVIRNRDDDSRGNRSDDDSDDDLNDDSDDRDDRDGSDDDDDSGRDHDDDDDDDHSGRGGDDDDASDDDGPDHDDDHDDDDDDDRRGRHGGDDDRNDD